jgi:hypothetical protein
VKRDQQAIHAGDRCLYTKSTFLRGASRARRDGWTLAETHELSGETRLRVEPSNAAYARAEQSLRNSAVALTSAWMHQEIQRIEAAVDADPALAIGTAKELVETCCKHIAGKLGVTVQPNADMPDIVKPTLKALRLVPEDISEKAKGSQTVKRILSNLSQITQGLAGLRNLYGSGHGRNSLHRGLQPRHARLAVACAAAFVEFATSTFNARVAELDRNVDQQP